MNTQRTVFDLYYHELSKNYRVLVNGNVHPLLCGLTDVADATQATFILFPEFSSFDNLHEAPLYLNAGGTSSKVNFIYELERIIALVKGTPDEQIEDIEMDIKIEFYREKTTTQIPNSPELQAKLDETRLRATNSAVSTLITAGKELDTYLRANPGYDGDTATMAPDEQEVVKVWKNYWEKHPEKLKDTVLDPDFYARNNRYQPEFPATLDELRIQVLDAEIEESTRSQRDPAYEEVLNKSLGLWSNVYFHNEFYRYWVAAHFDKISPLDLIDTLLDPKTYVWMGNNPKTVSLPTTVTELRERAHDFSMRLPHHPLRESVANRTFALCGDPSFTDEWLANFVVNKFNK